MKSTPVTPRTAKHLLTLLRKLAQGGTVSVESWGHIAGPPSRTGLLTCEITPATTLRCLLDGCIPYTVPIRAKHFRPKHVDEVKASYTKEGKVIIIHLLTATTDGVVDGGWRFKKA